VIYDDTINSLSEAAADSVEEAIYNSLCMAESMEGPEDRKAEAIPLDWLKETMERYKVHAPYSSDIGNRLDESSGGALIAHKRCTVWATANRRGSSIMPLSAPKKTQRPTSWVRTRLHALVATQVFSS